MTIADPRADSHVLPEIGGAGARASRPAATLRGGTPWLSALMIVVLGLTPLLAYLGNKAFAPVTALAGLLCLPLAWRGRGPPSLALIALLVTLAWALLSILWSPIKPPHLHSYRDFEASTGLKLALQAPLYLAIVVASARVSPAGAARALLVLAIGFLAIEAVLIFEGVRGQGLYRSLRAATGAVFREDLARRNVSRATYPLALLIWPCMLMLQRRPWAVGALVAGALASALLLKVDAPIVALLAGAFAWVVVRWGGRLGVVGLMSLAAAYFALAPQTVGVVSRAGAQAVADMGKLSWGARTVIWRFVTDRILDRPLLGWGLDASRAFPEAIPLHPHNGALQVWLELGAPGAALAALLVLGLFTGVERLRLRDPTLGAAAAACIAAYLAIGALSFGIWQEWWLALGAIAAVTLRLADRMRNPAPTPAPI